MAGNKANFENELFASHALKSIQWIEVVTSQATSFATRIMDREAGQWLTAINGQNAGLPNRASSLRLRYRQRWIGRCNLKIHMG